MNDKNNPPQPQQAQSLSQAQVTQLQENIRKAQSDMKDWREMSKATPEKMREPLSR